MEQIQYNTGLTNSEAPKPEAEPASTEATPAEEAPMEVSDVDTGSSEKDDSTEPQSSGSFEKYSTEFQETGALSDASFKELEAAGIPRSYVEQYISGLRLAQEQATRSLYDAVGGEEAYTSMIKWASETFSPDDIDAYNKAISQNAASQKLALESLKARYRAAVGSNEPSMLRGAKKVASGYRSTDEMVRAMSDPRYKTDPAYRADVEQRVRNASF